MEHVAIDLGGRESQICIRSEQGEVIHESRVETARLGRFLAKRPASRVLVETSAEAFRIADEALACGHEVRVVPATLVKQLGVGARGIKTDRRDARVLSEVSCRIDLPSVHVPSEQSRRLKSICGSREVLVGVRTKLINNVRGWLRTQLWRIRTGASSTFPSRVRAHGQVPPHIERMLVVLEQVSQEILTAEAEIAAFARSSEVCVRLMTVPGVGPVTATRFLAALDTRERFKTSHGVQSYLGLTPGEHSSSESERRTGITKAGSRQVRWVLVQAAWCALRIRPNDAMVRWARRVAERRGRHVAIVALARKLAGILFAIWRDGTTYKPSLGAEPEADS